MNTMSLMHARLKVPISLALILGLHILVTAQWVPLNGPAGAVAKCFAHSPTAILLATYHGAYRSTDDGGTWANTNTGLSSPYEMVTAATYHNNAFLLGTEKGEVYSSSDDGLTWSLIYTSGLELSIDAIVGSGSTLLVAESLGLAVSNDGGQTFSGVTGLLDTTYVTDLAVCGSSLFAGTTANGLLRSDDSGLTWQQVTLPVVDFATVYVMSLASEGPNMVVNTQGWTHYSSDFGQTFQITTSGIETAEPLCFHFDGTDLFCGSRDGVFRSTDLGVSYVPLLQDGSWTEAYLVHNGIHLAGSKSRGVLRSTDAGASWSRSVGDIKAWEIECMTTDGTYLYTGTVWNGVHRYDPNDQTWTALTDGLAEYDNYANDVGVVGPNVIHFATGRSWYSSDQGDSWSQVTGMNDGRILLQEGAASYLFGSHNSPPRLYTTANNGQAWTPVSNAMVNTPDAALLKDGRFYICRPPAYGIERSLDGITWVNVLPDSMITAMASGDNTIYAGVASGAVLASSDHGDTWTTLEPLNEAAPIILTLKVCNGLLTLSTEEALYKHVPGTGWVMVDQGLEGLRVISQLCDGTGIVVGTDHGGVFRQDHVLSVPEPTRAIGLVCIPNPSNGQFTVRATGVQGRVELDVMNAVGQVVHRSSSLSGLEQMNLELDVPAGCYTVRLFAEGGVVQQRVLIVR